MQSFSPVQLRAKRDEAGYSRPLLAQKVMLAASTVKDYETGRRIPSAAALGRLATALNCAVGDFYVQPSADSDVA